MKRLFFYVISFLGIFISISTNAQIEGNWTLTGPNLFPINDVYQINGIGRIEQIKFDPTNPSKVYATSASGGLFVSTNGTNSWASTGTDSSGLNAASVCIDYTNDNILYLGTGDLNYYSENYGIWKSIDGGANWAPSNTGIGNRLAVEIVMSPFNHNTLIVATDDGIWKSTDAGNTWVEKHIGGQFTDMQFKANATTKTLYAVTNTDYWYSTDMGETWNTVALPGPSASFQNGGRIGVSKADSNVVYLTFVGDDSANCTPVLKSVNSGVSFTVIKPANFCDLNGYDSASLGGYYQGNYNFCMAVDPGNINTIYIAAESVWRSTNGGATWNTNWGWWEGIHCDMHYFAFYPTDRTRLFNANDGGVWESTDSSTTWNPVSDGLSTSECYHAASSPIKQNFVCAGLQDNAGIYYNGSFPWHTFSGGDATQSWATDQQDSTVMYDLQGGVRQIFAGTQYSLDLPFSSGNYDLMDFSALQHNTAFTADSNIYITKTITYPNAFSWTKISSINKPFVAIASSPADSNLFFAVTANNRFYYTLNVLNPTPTWVFSITPASLVNGASIAPVESNKNVVYLSCGSRIYRSINKGTTWTNVTANLPNVNILKIYNDVHSTNEAIYLATANAVYYKDSTMTNWINFSKGLPNTCPITDLMMYNDGTTNSLLRVSFYGRGVWQSPLYSTIALNIPVNNTNETSLNAYPNPSNGQISVTFNAKQKDNYTLRIVNILGQIVYSKTLDNFFGAYSGQINLNKLSKGVYVLSLQSKDNICVKKLIVE